MRYKVVEKCSFKFVYNYSHFIAVQNIHIQSPIIKNVIKKNMIITPHKNINFLTASSGISYKL